MSPLHLRRYRAERLLRTEFDALRESVLRAVRGRLRDSGATLEQADLEACYSQAWQGLYAEILSGEEIENPSGWLVLVTYRRAIDEQRRRRPSAELAPDAAAVDRDIAAELDDRAKLRQLIEGFSANLSERERQAATLCYLQGLSREQAAERMGIAPRRMQKLMEGRGDGRPGVAAKVSALTESISQGRFCEDHASLMRAFAFGVLDPEGQRHRIALAHRNACPSCRAYVLSLRGLASVLPPVFIPGLVAELGLDGGAGASAAKSGARTRPDPHGPLRGGGAVDRLWRSAANRLGGLGGRVLGGGIGGAKLALAGAVLLSAGAAGIALSASPSHAHLHRHADSAPLSSGQRSLSGRSGHQAAARARHRSNVHRQAREHAARHRAGRHRPASSSASPALREFGIERPGAGTAGATPAAPAPKVGSAGQARREFGIE
jgi:RNA polymerase sigma factor (sigma-70 family)